VTVNGISSEIWYLLDPAQGLWMPEGNTSRRVIGKLREETRSPRPIRAIHNVNQATSETLRFLIATKHSSLTGRVCPRSGISDEDK
jgi:hypothetical protein